jgi:hypothetical protein
MAAVPAAPAPVLTITWQLKRSGSPWRWLVSLQL